jgi:hypothetical protein
VSEEEKKRFHDLGVQFGLDIALSVIDTAINDYSYAGDACVVANAKNVIRRHLKARKLLFSEMKSVEVN